MAISDELDLELRECLRRQKRDGTDDPARAMNDATAKVLFKMKTAPRTLLLCGTRKKAVIDRRQNCDARLRDMYYKNKF